MKLWNKIKQMIRKELEKSARREVLEFIYGAGPFKMYFPENLKKIGERRAYKQNLTATYTYQEGDDLLEKKQDFIEQYTVNEQEQFDYFINNNPFGKPGKIRTQAWRDHEQVERREAQKAWCQVVHRNHHDHMSQKFMNQKTK